MADPLPNWTDTGPGTQTDPLPGWQPDQVAPATAAAAPPQSRPSILNTSFEEAPSYANNGKYSFWNPAPFVPDETIMRLRGAASDAFRGSSIQTPELKEAAGSAPGLGGWLSRNVVSPLLDYPTGAIGAATTGATTLAAELAGRLDPRLARDVPQLITAAGVSGTGTSPAETTLRQRAADTAALREMSTPPAPTLPNLYRGPNPSNPSGPIPSDPVTLSAIQLLRRNTQPTDIPPPPQPFAQPVNLTPSSGGLLNMTPPQPAPSGGLLGPQSVPDILTAAELKARAQQGYYSPADKAAAQGAMLPQDSANAIRKTLTDAIPQDPQTARVVGNTPIVQAANNVLPDIGTPMSYDTAMAIDRDLTRRIRATNDKSEQMELGQAQDAVRDHMDQVPDLANLSGGRAYWNQYIKQSQMEDIDYRAGLRPEDKQSAYIRGQITSLLGNPNKVRNWSPDEIAQAQAVAKSGDLGALKNFGIGLIKPIAQSAGGGLGGWLFGAGGAYVGASVGGELGANLAARVRSNATQTSLDPIMQQITRNALNIPPAPQATPPTPQPFAGGPVPLGPQVATAPRTGPMIYSIRDGQPYDAQGNPINPTNQAQAELLARLRSSAETLRQARSARGAP